MCDGYGIDHSNALNRSHYVSDFSLFTSRRFRLINEAWLTSQTLTTTTRCHRVGFEARVALEVNLTGVTHCLVDVGKGDVVAVHLFGVAMAE